MAEIVSMPKLGFDMAEGTLVRWVVHEGDPIAKSSVLAEIETDKATVEVESAYDGVVLRELVKEGDIVPINTPIAVIGASGETVDLKALGLESGEKTTPAVQTAATIQPAAESAPVEKPAAATATPPIVPVTVEEAGYPDGRRASPLARRMAKERQIDLHMIKGSGPGGRIIKADIEGFQPAETQPALKEAAVTPVPAAPLQVTEARRADEFVTVSRLRSAIGRRMTESKQQVPHFYVTHEYDMAALMELRKQVNTLLPENEKISVNDFIVRAAALALRAYPNLNASLDGKKGQVVHHGDINIGVAVSVENGLMTVVCRKADTKSLRQIAGELRATVARAREGKVRPDDIEGSTFSISNLGMFDVEHFIAIINPPEAGILAVGSVREIPVVKNGEIVPGTRMKATISVDHRVSDGVEAARFMQELVKYLEEPLRLMV